MFLYPKTIRTGANLGALDVAMLREKPDMPPSEYHLVYIEDGVAKIGVSNYASPDKFEYQSTINPAIAVAIEYDGNWIRLENKKFTLITDPSPWIFYVTPSGELTAQQLTSLVLATGVIQVTAIRGWKNVVMPEVDQGLICAYIKTDNKVYYRNYARQLDDTFQWEIEREITQFAPPVQNVALFRTNDYRTGFIVESNGIISWALTARAWAGMAITPENISSSITDLLIEVTYSPIQNMDLFIEDSNISSSVSEVIIDVCPYDYEYSQIQILKASRISNYQIKLTFTHEILNVINQVPLFTVNGFTVTATGYGNTQKEIVITVAQILPVVGSFIVTYSKKYGALKAVVTSYSTPHIETFTVTAIGSPPLHINNLSSVINSLIIRSTQVYYSSAYTEDHRINSTIGLLIVTVTKVGSNPL